MSCDRFEREGLMRLEQGLPLGEHFAECPDCQRELATYQQLMDQISSAGESYEPPPYWQTRVVATIDERARQRRRRWGWLLIPAAAAGMLVWSLWRPGLPLELPPATTQLALVVGIESGESIRRGDEAHPGDRLRLEAEVGEAEHVELRLYRQDRELIMSCSTQPPCQRRGGELTATVELAAVGAYQALVLASEQPLPAATGGMDSDIAAVLSTGAQVELGRSVDVR